MTTYSKDVILAIQGEILTTKNEINHRQLWNRIAIHLNQKWHKILVSCTKN